MKDDTEEKNLVVISDDEDELGEFVQFRQSYLTFICTVRDRL